MNGKPVSNTKAVLKYTIGDWEYTDIGFFDDDHLLNSNGTRHKYKGYNPYGEEEDDDICGHYYYTGEWSKGSMNKECLITFLEFDEKDSYGLEDDAQV